MRLLILGTGSMAAQHAKHFAAIDGVTVVGGVDVDPNRLAKFNAEHKIEHGFASLDAALAWGEFDAVANVTPDSIHHPTSIAALKGGKHVFCEKPLATDATKAFEMAEIAEQAGLVNMVNLTYRNVAQLQTARQIVTSGQIGAVRRPAIGCALDDHQEHKRQNDFGNQAGHQGILPRGMRFVAVRGESTGQIEAGLSAGDDI